MNDKEYIIENVIKSGEFTGQYGLTIKYTIQAGGETGDLNQKVNTPAPKIGDKIFGHFEDTQYGKRFKKASQAGGGYKSNPETQLQIMRQNALTNAVNYCIGKAGFMEKKEGLKFLTGKEIIEVAFYFSQFSEGKIDFNHKEPETKEQEPKTEEEEEILDFVGRELEDRDEKD